MAHSTAEGFVAPGWEPVRAAFDKIAENGLEGLRLRDVAAAAGIDHSTVHHYFATKEDLYRAILDLKTDPARSREGRRQLEDCAARRDDAGFFRTVVLEIFQSFRDDPAFHRLTVYRHGG